MTITTITKTGTGTMEYPKNLEQQASARLLTQYLQYVQASVTPKAGNTKTRGEVRGGGIKPWKQKGTGRARHGSIRSPLWVGGGITFGPRSGDHRIFHMNKKMRRLAYLTLLTDLAKNARLAVVPEDSLTAKELRVQIQNLTAKNNRVILVEQFKGKSSLRGAKNLAKATMVDNNHFGATQMIGNVGVVITAEAWTALTDRFKQ